MNSSLLLQQCPPCFVHLTRMVFEMGSMWPYSYCFLGCCLKDLFKRAHSNLVWFPSSLFFMHFVSIHVVHQYSSIDTATAWEKFHMINNLYISVHTFTRCISISLSVDEILLLKHVNLFTNYRCLPLRVEMAPSHFIYMYSVLFAFMWRPMPPAVCSRLCSRDSVWTITRLFA